MSGDLDFDMCVNVNLNMGGWGGAIDPALASVHLLVDYVRVSAL